MVSTHIQESSGLTDITELVDDARMHLEDGVSAPYAQSVMWAKRSYYSRTKDGGVSSFIGMNEVSAALKIAGYNVDIMPKMEDLKWDIQ